MAKSVRSWRLNVKMPSPVKCPFWQLLTGHCLTPGNDMCCHFISENLKKVKSEKDPALKHGVRGLPREAIGMNLLRRVTPHNRLTHTGGSDTKTSCGFLNCIPLSTRDSAGFMQHLGKPLRPHGAGTESSVSLQIVIAIRRVRSHHVMTKFHSGSRNLRITT